MATILISEPDPQVQRMLERMAARLGHQPIAVRIPAPFHLTSADVLLAELADPLAMVCAQAVQIANPSVAIVCASVTGPPAELAELGIELEAYLVKPFSSGQLDAVIRQALADRPDVDRRGADDQPSERDRRHAA
jgi:hypothetical protein